MLGSKVTLSLTSMPYLDIANKIYPIIKGSNNEYLCLCWEFMPPERIL